MHRNMALEPHHTYPQMGNFSRIHTFSFCGLKPKDYFLRLGCAAMDTQYAAMNPHTP